MASIKMRIALAAALFVSISIPGASARAEEAASSRDFPLDLTGGLTAISDYNTRGVSQTMNSPAIQGWLDFAYSADKRIIPYIGVWASNVEYITPPGFDRATMVVDLMAGMRGSQALAEGYALTYGASFEYFKYLGASDHLNYDYVEFGASSGIRTPIGSASIGLQASPSYFVNAGEGYYLYGSVDIPLPIAMPVPLSFSVVGNLARLWVQKNDVYGLPDYNRWQAGLSAAYQPFALALTVVYIGNDIEKADCVGGSNICDSRVVGGLTKTF